MKLRTKILGGIAIVIIIIQFFQIDKSAIDFDRSKDLLVNEKVPSEVKQILKQACYDCHSNESKYPWYTYVAPLSWWIADHIEEARDELNFSDWATYTVKRKKHKMEEIAEMVEEGEMPLDSYTWAHSEARLSDEQKNVLIQWAKTTMNEIK
jgi:signal recognition particle subunit SEC65